MKKTLIVNAVQIGGESGTGNTLKNITKQIPGENLLQLIVMPKLEGIDSNIETFCTPLSFCSFPYRIQRKRMCSRKKVEQRNNKGDAAKNIKTSTFNIFLSGVLDAWPISCECLYQRLDEFKPEIIYTCAGSIRIMKAVNNISKHYGIPVVIHLMDDWPNTIYDTSLLLKPFRWLALKELRVLYSRTQVNYAISEGLGEKYTAMYHKKHIALMNPADIYPIDTDEAVPYCEDQSVKFLYAGSLSLNRDKSLLEIAASLFDLRKRGFANHFDIYVSKTLINDYNINRFSQYGVHLHPYVSPAKVYELYAKYDVLVYTESFDKSNIDFTSYSLSTKVPEYLASKRPILAYLPEQLFSAQFLEQKQVAKVAHNTTELMMSCQRLIEDHSLRLRLAHNGRELAEREFSYEQVQKKIEQVFGK